MRSGSSVNIFRSKAKPKVAALPVPYKWTAADANNPAERAVNTCSGQQALHRIPAAWTPANASTCPTTNIEFQFYCATVDPPASGLASEREAVFDPFSIQQSNKEKWEN